MHSFEKEAKILLSLNALQITKELMVQDCKNKVSQLEKLLEKSRQSERTKTLHILVLDRGISILQDYLNIVLRKEAEYIRAIRKKASC